eukprot:scaffold11206_cov117-Isochrysis_galbana.AAC.3
MRLTERQWGLRMVEVEPGPKSRDGRAHTGCAAEKNNDSSNRATSPAPSAWPADTQLQPCMGSGGVPGCSVTSNMTTEISV